MHCTTRAVPVNPTERIIFGLVTYFNRKYETKKCPVLQKKARRVA
jgi:hypothetical protein